MMRISTYYFNSANHFQPRIKIGQGPEMLGIGEKRKAVKLI